MLSMLAFALAATAPVTAPVEADADLLPEITVTATRLPGDAAALPPMISVVGRDEIARRPADQTPNLLVGVPGVLVQKSNHGGGSPFIHGMTGKQVLLMVDGVRMNNSLYRFGPHQYLNTIDPYTIERIEVVRGPSSVLYGTDAMGGVVNVITRDPKHGPLTPGLAAGASSADASLRGRLQVDGHVTQTGVLAGASGRRFDNLRAGGGVGVQPATGYDETAADFKITHQATDNLRLVAATQLLRQYDVPKSNEVLLGGKVKYDYEPQLRWLTYGKIERKKAGFFDDVQLAVSMQQHEEGEQIVSKPGAPERTELTRARTFGAFLHLSKDVGLGHVAGMGAEWYADRIASEASEAGTTGTFAVRPTFPDGARYETFGAYLQDEFRPHESLGLLFGGRYSRFRASGSLPNPAGAPTSLHLSTDDISGSAGVTWEFIDGLWLAGQGAQGFRAPNMEDFFGKVDFATEIPNTELRPEKSVDWEAGLKIRKWGLRGDTYYFRTYYRDLIDRAEVQADVDGDGALDKVVQRRNITRASLHGVESGLTYALAPVEVFGTYAWTFGDKLGKKDGAWKPVEPLRRVPPRQGTAGLRVFLPRESFAGVDTQWSLRGDRLAPGDITDPRIGPAGTPGYVVANVRGGVGLGTSGRVRFGVENVLDKQYKTHGSGLWLPGRNVYVDYSIGL